MTSALATASLMETQPPTVVVPPMLDMASTALVTPTVRLFVRGADGAACGRGAAGPAVAHEVTRVTFRPLDARDIAAYVAAGEWEGRAGAYAIQGVGASLVERIDGDYLNVVGLPVAELVRLAPDLVR